MSHETNDRPKNIEAVIKRRVPREKKAPSEEDAKKEMGDLTDLLSVAKMVAFKHYHSEEVTDASLIEALNILKREEQLRQKFEETDTNIQRLGRLIRHRDRLAVIAGGFIEENEDGTDVFNFEQSRTNLEATAWMEAVNNTLTLHYALKPILPQSLIERELDRRIDDGIDLGTIDPYGVPPKLQLPADYGNFTDGDYSAFYAQINKDNDTEEPKY